MSLRQEFSRRKLRAVKRSGGDDVAASGSSAAPLECPLLPEELARE